MSQSQSYELHADDTQLYIVFSCPEVDITTIVVGFVISYTDHCFTIGHFKIPAFIYYNMLLNIRCVNATDDVHLPCLQVGQLGILLKSVATFFCHLLNPITLYLGHISGKMNIKVGTEITG